MTGGFPRLVAAMSASDPAPTPAVMGNRFSPSNRHPVISTITDTRTTRAMPLERSSGSSDTSNSSQPFCGAVRGHDHTHLPERRVVRGHLARHARRICLIPWDNDLVAADRFRLITPRYDEGGWWCGIKRRRPCRNFSGQWHPPSLPTGAARPHRRAPSPRRMHRPY